MRRLESARPAFATETITAEALGLATRDTLERAGSIPSRPRLAIIGSRAARLPLCELAGAAVAVAGARGWSVISGGALGIDAAVHRAALREGVPQLAVLPCGPDQPYPAAHAPLFHAVASAPGSGLLFAHPPGTRLARGMFASRNRFVVALADAVLVVQASSRSGSCGTGRLSLRRRVATAAVCGSPGCGLLIEAGAHPLPGPAPLGFSVVGGSFAQRLERWLARAVPSGSGELGAAAAAELAGWPESLRWLARALVDAGPRGLGVDSAEDPGALLEALTEAEALGLIVETRPGRFRRCV
ncbi:MAG: DNA-processing protein DprA [Myxococcales bacterium]|nr:DNA-processing protein DprA [Myxococcales bacterium]